MEIIAGLTDQKKTVITTNSALHMTILTVADITFLTNLQKRENQLNRFALDNMKKQVA